MRSYEDKVRQAREILRQVSPSASVACVGLFSGGNDSTVMMHLCRSMLTHALHINTGIGIPETTQFVRETCQKWRIPLIERVTDPNVYERFVLGEEPFKQGGFPGPSAHSTIYWHLKQQHLRAVRRSFVTQLGQRIIYVTGIRKSESRRRMFRRVSDEIRREGSILWVNPITHFDDETMAWYREEYDVPTNPVCVNLHRSGECLCGAFANPAELDEIAFFYPRIASRIRDLEKKAKEAGIERCKWGGSGRGEKPTAGYLCSTCKVESQITEEEGQ